MNKRDALLQQSRSITPPEPYINRYLAKQADQKMGRGPGVDSQPQQERRTSEVRERLERLSKAQGAAVKARVGTKTKETETKEELLQEALRLHHAATVDDDKEAVVKAHDLFQKLHRLDPEDPLIEAYYGSTLTLLGRDAGDPTERLKNATEGLKIIDRVVNRVPDHVQVRILRANMCFRLPEMYFHRTGTAIEDFQYLVSRYEEDNSVFSEELYRRILDNLGQAYKNVDQLQESKVIWKKLFNLTNEAKYATRLEKEELELTRKAPFDEEDYSAFAVEKKALIKQGKDLHARALEGDQEACVQAYELFDQAHQADPLDQLIAAYYADCLAMTGQGSGDSHSMFAKVYKAIKILDNAVYGDPDNIQIRFLRAYQSLRLSETFFRRAATAKEDLEYILERYEQDNTIFFQETHWQVLYNLVIAYKRLEMEKKAQATLEKLRSLDPGRFSRLAEISRVISDCKFGRAPLPEDYIISKSLGENL